MGSDQSKPEDETNEDKLREIARMDQAVRSKVRGGVQYNMKVIIRGERGSGKSTLWRRFQGMQFSEKYDATPEIQSATINWSFRSGEDSVKVDVWDVVDKALKPRSLPKLETGQFGRHNFDYLDASIVDVYKDTHAALFLVNPRSVSSLSYVREHAKQVPLSVCLLIIYNFRDVVEFHPDQCAVSYDHVVSLADDIKAFRQESFLAESRLKGPESDCIPPTDTFAVPMALPNCFGLLELNQFLDIPFLHLKQRALREQLMKAHRDLGDAQNVLHEALRVMNYAPYAAREAEEQKQRLFEQQNVMNQERNPATAEAEEAERSEKLSTSLQRRTEEAREEDLRQQTRLKQQGALKLTHSSSRDDNSSDSDGYAFRKKSAKTNKPSKEVEKHHEQKSGKLSKDSKNNKAAVSTPAPQTSQSVFEQEVASFAPAEMGLEGFLQPSDDEERLLRHQKDKIRAYVVPPSQSRDRTKNMQSSSFGDSDSDEDDDDAIENRRFQAKSASAGRLARRAAPLPSQKSSSSAPLSGSITSTDIMGTALEAFLDSSDEEGGPVLPLRSQSSRPAGPSSGVISSSGAADKLTQAQHVMDQTNMNEEQDAISPAGEKARKKGGKRDRDREKDGSGDKRAEAASSREKEKKEKEKDRKKDKEKKEKSTKKSAQFQHSSDDDGTLLGTGGGSLRRKAAASIPNEVEL